MNHHHSDKRGELLHYLEDYWLDHGYPPTYDEIRQALGLSSRSHAGYYLLSLEQEGLITRRPNSPRSLRLVNPPVVRHRLAVTFHTHDQASRAGR